MNFLHFRGKHQLFILKLPPPKKNLSEKWFNIVTKSCTFCKYPGFVCSFIYCVLSFLLVWRLSLCIKNIYLLLGLWSVVKHLPIMGNAKGLVPNATKKKSILYFLPHFKFHSPHLCYVDCNFNLMEILKENLGSKFQSIWAGRSTLAVVVSLHIQMEALLTWVIRQLGESFQCPLGEEYGGTQITFIPSTWETEAGASEVVGQPKVHSKTPSQSPTSRNTKTSLKKC